MGELHLSGQAAAEAIQHQRTLAPIQRANLRDVGIEVILGHIPIAKHLKEDVGVHILALLGDDHL